MRPRSTTPAWLLLLVLPLACGSPDGENETDPEPTPAAGEATPATAPNSDDREETTVVESGTDAAPPADPVETAVQLIEAFESGDQARATDLMPRRRWGDDAGFERMAQQYRDLEFDLRREAIQVYEQGGLWQVAVPATGEETEWVYVFMVYQEDGAYRVDAVEARVAGVP